MYAKSDPTTDKEYLAKEQYKGTQNFQHRTNIFAYGTNVDLREWEATQYTGDFNLNICQNILEVGCGDGAFWKYVPSTTYSDKQITLCDLSFSMLQACSVNLASLEIQIPINYVQADIDYLPFKSPSFDAVLAHNVIYHSSNSMQALRNIKESLKPEGFLGISVLNSNVNQAIWEMAHEIEEQVPNHSFTATFSEKEAEQELPKFFTRVKKREYCNSLHFKESSPVVNMVKSSPVVQKLNLSNMFFDTLTSKVEAKIEENGEFITEFNASLYLCKK
jgi:ubiquinone/menaquinone biosynthesis C-methylase UbiE